MEIGINCAVCGQPIDTAEPFTRIAYTGDYVHSGEDSCEGRYWDPPGESFLTEGSW